MHESHEFLRNLALVLGVAALTTVVCQVVQRISKDLVPRRLHRRLSIHEQSPLRQQKEIVVCGGQ